MERDQLIEQLFKSGSKEEILASINEYQKKLEAAAATREKVKNERREAAIETLIDYIVELIPDLKSANLAEQQEMHDSIEKMLKTEFEPYIARALRLLDYAKKVPTKPVRSDAKASDDDKINKFINDIMRAL